MDKNGSAILIGANCRCQCIIPWHPQMLLATCLTRCLLSQARSSFVSSTARPPPDTCTVEGAAAAVREEPTLQNVSASLKVMDR